MDIVHAIDILPFLQCLQIQGIAVFIQYLSVILSSLFCSEGFMQLNAQFAVVPSVLVCVLLLGTQFIAPTKVVLLTIVRGLALMYSVVLQQQYG